MKNNNSEKEFTPKESARIEAFSDGVFAIAITLLILELIQFLQPQREEKLLSILFSHWESYMAFAIGFLTILICWINHHLVFNYIVKTDSGLMWANGFVLLVVTFTPFPTAILAEYFAKESHTAMAIFGINYIMMSIAAYSLTAYMYNRSLIREESRELFYYFKKLYLYSIFYTLFVFFVCFLSVVAAIFFYCILFAAFAFPKEVSLIIMKRRKKGINKK